MAGKGKFHTVVRSGLLRERKKAGTGLLLSHTGIRANGIHGHNEPYSYALTRSPNGYSIGTDEGMTASYSFIQSLCYSVKTTT